MGSRLRNKFLPNSNFLLNISRRRITNYKRNATPEAQKFTDDRENGAIGYFNRMIKITLTLMLEK